MFFHLLPSIEDVHFRGKRVFVRADLNVPLLDGNIVNDHKLESFEPTLRFLLNNNARVVLATHIGRPHNKEEELSTKRLLPWFRGAGYDIEHVASIDQAATASSKGIILLENMRFFPGEKGGDQAFAQQLKAWGDIYLNDAFGLIHRSDTSITLLPQLYSRSSKAMGLLVHKELHELSKLASNPAQPFVVVVGGNKAPEKISFLTSLVQKNTQNRPATILVGGAIAYNILKAQGKSVGQSLVDNEAVNAARTLLETARQNNVTLILPVDHSVTLGEQGMTITKTIPDNGVGVDIGPETSRIFAHYLGNAKTIFANGTMGIYTSSKFAQGTHIIFEEIAAADAYSVVGGGDATAAVRRFGLEKGMTFLSTGGGASLAFLGMSDGEFKNLPAVAALL